MKTRGALHPECIPLQPLSQHHFNWKHLLGGVNCHLLRANNPSSICPLSHSPSSSVSLSRLPFHSHFLVSFHFSPISLPSRSAPCSPSLPLPPSACSSAAEYSPSSHEYVCVILRRQIYLKIQGGECFLSCPLIHKSESVGGEKWGWMRLM